MRPKRVHVWTDANADGSQHCRNCGATRAISLSGWKRNPAMLNGRRKPFCSAKTQKQQPPPAMAVGVPAKIGPLPPTLTESAKQELREP